jgi:hypothetical protein
MELTITEGRKLCTHCREWLLLADFPPNPQISTGLSSWCRECHRKATREWRKRHRDYDREYRERNPEKVAPYNVRRRKDGKCKS